jgi:hypothetical protein
MKRATGILLLTLALILLHASGAAAQSAMYPGRFAMEWVDVTRPVSSNLPDLTYGNTTVDLRDSGSECPPTSRYSISSPYGFGAGSESVWCFAADGSLDSSANFYVGGTVWYAPNGTGGFDVFQLEMEHGSRGCCTVHAVGRRVATTTPPPATALKVSITAPRPPAPGTAVTVSGIAWVTAWSEGVSSGTFKFELVVDNAVRATTTQTSRGPASLRWDTAASGKGTKRVQVRVTVGSASGTSADLVVNVQ